MVRAGSLYFDKRPVLTLVADEKYPHLFRIRYPAGGSPRLQTVKRRPGKLVTLRQKARVIKKSR